MSKMKVVLMFGGAFFSLFIVALAPACLMDQHSIRGGIFSFYWAMGVVCGGTQLILHKLLPVDKAISPTRNVVYWVVVALFYLLIFWAGIEGLIEAYEKQKHVADLYLWLLQKSGTFIDGAAKKE